MHCLTLYGWGGPWAGAWPLLAIAVLFKVAVWALLVTALILGIRLLRRSSRAGAATPLEILRARYARGELSRQDFDSMRHDLER
jgi:putative membrane protein